MRSNDAWDCAAGSRAAADNCMRQQRRRASACVGVTGVTAREPMLREEQSSDGPHAEQSLLPGVSARLKTELM